VGVVGRVPYLSRWEAEQLNSKLLGSSPAVDRRQPFRIEDILRELQLPSGVL
jgi:hypothetical protein